MRVWQDVKIPTLHLNIIGIYYFYQKIAYIIKLQLHKKKNYKIIILYFITKLYKLEHASSINERKK